MFTRDGPSMLELLRQALSSTERGYDLLAPKFERTPFRTPDAFVDGALSILPAHVASAIDVCCGTGVGLAALAKRADRVVGLDISRGMLAQAQVRVPGAELVRGDVLAPPPWLGTFDVVTCFGALGHIPVHDEPRFAASIVSLLNPGGRFVFITAPPPPLLSRAFLLGRTFNAIMHVRNAVWRPQFVMYYLTFTLPRARALLEAAGLRVDVHHGKLPAPYLVVEATR